MPCSYPKYQLICDTTTLKLTFHVEIKVQIVETIKLLISIRSTCWQEVKEFSGIIQVIFRYVLRRVFMWGLFAWPGNAKVFCLNHVCETWNKSGSSNFLGAFLNTKVDQKPVSIVECNEKPNKNYKGLHNIEQLEK